MSCHTGRTTPGAMRWLKENAVEYEGKWVALGPGGLVAVGRSLAEIREQVPDIGSVLVTVVA